MAINYTTNYNLKKPDGDEFFNINDANNNMDLIDTTIKSANDAVASKVDKVTGKALSTNDYTTADKTIVGNVTTNLNLKVDKTTVNSIITSLDFKVDKVTGKMLSDNNYTTAEKTIVGNVTTNLSNKVDKISGKGLSANDYTDSAKAIVDGVTAKINTNIDNIATNATNIASNLSAINSNKVVTGTYTGDLSGDTSGTKDIVLGFKPRFVQVIPKNNSPYSAAGVSPRTYYGAVATETFFFEVYQSTTYIGSPLKITENGFQVNYNQDYKIFTNASYEQYMYIAYK